MIFPFSCFFFFEMVLCNQLLDMFVYSVKRKCIKEVRGIGKKSQIFNHFLIILDQQLHPINSC